MRGSRGHARVAAFVPLSVALVLALPAVAQASGLTYCVYSPTACPSGATTEATIQDAITASDMGTGTNTILVGPGIHAESFTKPIGTSSVEIIGQGEAATALIGTEEIDDPGSSLSDLTIAITAAASVGVRLTGGTVDSVAINDAAAPGGDNVGIFSGSSVTVRDADVTLSKPNDTALDAFFAGLSGDTLTVDDSTLASPTNGVADQIGSAVDLHRDTLSGLQPVYDQESGGTLRVEDSLLDAAPSGVGLWADDTPTADSTVIADHDTIVSSGAGADGIYATASHGHAVSVTGHDTVIDPASFASSIQSLQPAGTSTVTLSNSDFNPATAGGTGGYPAAGTNGNLNVPPGFAGGSFPYALAAASPLIDAGVPGPLPAGEQSTTDLLGNPRTLIGASGCPAPRTDIGAYEYSPATIALSTSPPPVGVSAGGGAVKFSATACDPDPSQALTAVWTFADGATASGLNVSHAFATGGPKVNTLRVTDASGRVGSASVSFGVSAPSRKAVAGAIGFRTRTLTASKLGRLALPLSCPALNSATSCTGTLVLKEKVSRTTGHGRHRKRRTVTLTVSRARFSVLSNRTKTVSLKLTSAVFKALKRARHLKLTAAATSSPGPITTTAVLTIKAPPRARHR
jgi:hypothetical protein